MDLNEILNALQSRQINPGEAEAMLNGSPSAAKGKGQLHPLLHENTSDLEGVRFRSIFSGEEFFLADHVVQGHRMLPGVAYLEMARAAVEQISGERSGERLYLRSISWERPLVVEGSQAKPVEVELWREDTGEISYQMVDQTGEVYSRGVAGWQASSAAEVLDIGHYRGCLEGVEREAAECYQGWSGAGIEYGPGHRGLESVGVGREAGGQRFALGRLSLPEAVSGSGAEYVLHPSVLDAALQATIGLMEGEGGAASLPFAVERVEIYGASPERGWALVRESAASTEKVRFLDIDVCDEQGELRLRLHRFSARVLEAGGEASGTVYLERVFAAQAASEGREHEFLERWLFLVGLEHAASIAEQMSAVRCVVLEGAADDAAEAFEQRGLSLLQQLSEIARARRGRRVLVQVAAEGELYAGLSGLLKTAHLEDPNLICQLILLEAGQDVAARIEENVSSPALVIRYRDGVRQVESYQEIAEPAVKGEIFRKGGVYLITGGAGGLGRLFAAEIAARVVGAKLVLVGRSELTAERQRELEGLSQLGREVEVVYDRADVSSLESMESLRDRVEQRWGHVDGVIHAAGQLRDRLLVNKTVSEAAEVLSVKVRGAVHLDAISRGWGLDFFVLFSSGAGAWGNVGQSDYALGNAFLDAYAAYRNGQVAIGARAGRTLSINWPLWADGGMGQDQATAERGMPALGTAAGLEAFYRALGTGLSQVAVVHGDRRRIRAMLASLVERPKPAQRTLPANADLAAEAVTYFRSFFGAALKLPFAQVEADAAMEQFGIDSILVMRLTSELEKLFGPLSKTLFFEYQTVGDLAGYFAHSHADRLQALIGKEEASRETQNAYALPAAPSTTMKRRSRRHEGQSAVVEPKRSSEIAIVGLSGRYPGAASVAEFWQNLKNGKDCITEIPGDRWDYRLYFDAEKGKAGKSYSKWGGFIDGVDRFDSLFFNISPREAQGMDPQERLFLECVWSTLEDGGYTRETAALDGKVGVFVGVMYEEYQMYGAQAQLMGPGYALPGNPASIANRVSYFCNFHGPSMAVDTMCSSSLTAIHLACQSLERGECVAALAGGVNLSVHPNKYLGLSQGQFVSSKGRCESFGEGGDGYVPGEGVGAVLLKPLWRAEADGDHIYGVIKASALNHGGKTNGYSVPNPQAQAAVIGQALQESHIPARAVTYIEAHGTGTSLGDPIEMAGLGRAFSALTDEKGFCAVGSAKSNIGHCESAAGIAGLTKVLLQMQHGQLAPSLHAEKLNPHIEFAGSPFAVQRELAEWQRPRIGEREYPRIAGLSSFGAGGANAHMVISEYVPVVNREEAWSGPALIVLSARQPEGLRRRVEQLLAALAERREADLGSIAYTLQVGREGMEHRLALSVRTLAELRDRLQRYLAGEAGIEDLYTGEVKRNKETVSVFSADEDLQGAVEAWLAKGKYGKLLEMWVKGLSFDWSRLYAGAKPQRISLPAYPFSGERHWVPKLEAAAKGKGHLHPLLHENTSDLEGVRFRSIFSGEEFFLADHVVQGHRMLPGVAYLEMARAAVEQISGERSGERLYLRSISWERPLVVEGSQAKPVEVELWREDTGEISYQVMDQAGEVYSRGVAGWQASSAAEVLDIGHYRGCLEGVEREAAECYQGWSGAGIEYGPGHRGLESVGVGREAGGQRFALGRLSLPEAVSGSGGEYVLHPSVLDAALQATIGLMEGEGGAASLPFAVERVEIYGASPERGWALVRESAASTEKVRFLDIDVCDEQGELRLRLHRFSARVLESGGEASGTVYLERVFAEQDVEEVREHEWAEQELSDRWLFLVDVERAASIAEQMSAVRCVVLERAADGAAEAFEQRGLSLLQQLSEIARARRGRRVLVQVAAAGELYAGLSGLLKTAHLEDPNLVCQLILLEAGQDVAARIEENVSSPALVIRYRDGVRQVERYQEIAEPAVKGEIFRKGGVYLITGGAGGLGRLFAAEIAARVVGAKLVLVGRSELTAERQGELEGLSQLGREVEVVYDRADVSSLESMESLRDRVEQRWGHVDGVIHAAGQLRDRLLVNKTVSEAAEVLSVKVRGAVHLDAISRGWGLDFFVSFSSGAGAWGNVGQSDYAMGNAFLDAYAAYRNDQVASGTRAGRTLSINWPLWAEGGMGHDQATAERGMPALGTAVGLEAFYRALGTGLSQVAVVYGDRRRIRAMLASQAERPKPVQSREAPEPGDRGLEEKTVEYLRRFMGAALQLSAAQVEPDAPLEQYGIDSVLVMRLTSELEKSFGTLPKTLFFEYQTVAELAGYFARSHAGSLRSLLGLGPLGKTLLLPMPVPPKSRASRRKPSAAVEPKRTSDIAIVGLSGRYPGAGSVAEFWENLKNGRDCITEIPGDRWDYRLYFDAEKGKAGKSYSKWGGFIDGVDRFDSLFFNISPREAQGMDPQERLFLECVWSTLEDGGYTRETAASDGKVGVFVGVMYEEYQMYGAQAQALGTNYSLIGNPASIANRVSYFCNFHGPSMAVDTMCSSSLTAIHLACQSLERGECVSAVAGGVNLSVHPNKYLGLSQGQFVSSKGRCESFGEGGDGYVPGEGVGAVLLKPLWRAEADGDHIYGVIKASALNHGGKTNGYSVPNPQAQAAVIGQALQESHIPARAVTYIEAHGTGTSLGDPIEMAGLGRAFSALTDEKDFCAVGSAKSNIGHCESAAGIAGLTKVLLQMQHGQLAPSLHAEKLNPHIEFAGSPFAVQRELAEWQRPKIGEREYPRIAGLSSFGAGGANAHMVISEYVPMVNREKAWSGPALVVLSARQPEGLRRRVEQLLAALQELPEADLGSIAYTLQVGREGMEHRLALSVRTLAELRDRLQRYLAGEAGIEDLYTGEVKRNKETVSVISADEDLQAGIEAWMAKGKYSKLLEMWVKGLTFDWSRLYSGAKPQRISLPAYPFSGERHWLPKLEAAAVAKGRSQLHPLLQENTSDLDGVRFSSNFSGEESFLADHVVQGHRMLPGVAYLEMARAAVEEIHRLPEDEASESTPPAFSFQHIGFVTPLVVDQPVTVHTALYPEDSGRIAFEIYSTRQGTITVHAQGTAIPRPSREIRRIDLAAMQAMQTGESLSSEHCYDTFADVGLQYGPSYRGVEKVTVMEDEHGQRFGLASITLPAVAGATRSLYGLHPSVLDSALHSSLGLTISAHLAGKERDPWLPFAMEECNILAPCPAKVWVVIREGMTTTANLRKLDFDLCGLDGSVCVEIRGFTARPLRAQAATDAVPCLTFTEQWVAQPLLPGQNASPRFVLCCFADGALQQTAAQSWNAVSPQTSIVFVAMTDLNAEFLRRIAEEKGVPDALLYVSRDGSDHREVASLLRSVVEAGLNPPQLLLACEYQNQLERAYVDSWIGFARSLKLALPQTRIVVVGSDGQADGLVSQVWTELLHGSQESVFYQQGQRQVCRIEPVQRSSARVVLRREGTYLITGGTGGLGMLIARHLGTRYGAKLILTGRSALSAGKQEQIAALEQAGAQVLYWQTDVCDLAAMQAKLGTARERFGPVQGVIHAAGVEGGSQLSGEDDFASVLAPKVEGTIALDALLCDEPLDFVCFFSSSSAVLGDFGSCDYAVGNRFQTAYAGYRQQLVAQGKAKGQTVAINWPLWQDGAMGQQDEAGISFYLKSTGQRLLEAEEGCELFERLLGEQHVQQLVLAADPARVSRLLGLQPMGVPAERKASVLKHQQPGLAGRTVVYLKKLLSSSLQLPVDRIDPEAALEEYGIDSVLVMQMTGELEKVFGSLSKTLFFEFQTIDTLAGYFLQQHRDRLAELLGETQPAALEEAPAAEPVAAAPAGRLSRRGRRRLVEQSAVVEQKRTSEIAIVGISGRYPGAGSVAEFWQNLKNGKDCITEIPGDRWDYRLYFDAEKGKAGKSYSKWGGFIDGVDRFDSLFFNISPREAQGMDPQERLFLECVWSTLEDGGYTRETAAPHGKVGVFVGVMYEEYQMYGAQAQMVGEGYALPGNSASMANRISYFCNFHGPSMAVNTMCSSSLTAIHLACQSLERGECVAALAGGVNLSVHPNKYLGLSQGQFVSSKGRCESFGEGGDGYVPGEGVGAVLLKPLWRAEADGDHIYGVIKASALNHGGKTNGYSVPNPQAQAAVIGQALQESHIPARAITYIEAHGTGTSLGDPIEMAGLGRAFSALTEEKGFCAVGSAKSNIGHCESAAGIAGLTKVLLQMQHGQLAPSLHAEKLNPHIEFAGSPFAVQRELAEWRRPKIGEREYPRIAGLSSFGAGGANAHMVISEYVPVVNRKEAWSGPALIVLSARQPEGLRRRAEQLLAALQELPEADLGSIAYTLQVGREGMEHRLALSVRTLAELRDRLQRYLAGEAGIEDLYTGEVKRNKETVSVISTDEDLQSGIEAWVAKGKYGKLLEMWVKGLTFDWSGLYTGAKPQRISLPAYPFSGERHWVPMLEAAAAKGRGHLHPLLHENTSDLDGVRFSSNFSGEEFFLADHVVQGHRMLPGVAYLEMARAAVEEIHRLQGDEASESTPPVFSFQHIGFVTPLMVDQPLTVHTALYPEESGRIAFEIYSKQEGCPISHRALQRGDVGPSASGAASEMSESGGVALAPALSYAKQGTITVHAQGTAVPQPSRQIRRIDLSAMQNVASLSSAQCYDAFACVDIQYGPSFRGVEKVEVMEDEHGQRFGLASITLPAVAGATRSLYGLHPSVLDSALHSSLGLTIAAHTAEKERDPWLPFAMEECNILGPCPSKARVVIRESITTAANLHKLDFDLCDLDGSVCVEIRGFTTRPLRAQAATDTMPCRTFTEQWVAQPLLSGQNASPRFVLCCLADGALQQTATQSWNAVSPQTSVVFVAMTEVNAERMRRIAEEKGAPDAVLYVSRDGSDHREVASLLRSVAEAGLNPPQLLLACEYQDQLERAYVDSWIGFARSLKRSLPQTRIAVVGSDGQADGLVSQVWTELLHGSQESVFYQQGQRQVCRIEPVQRSSAGTVLRREGTYLITGGAGGLGMLIARHLGTHYGAKLILTGRSALSAGKQEQIAALEQAGAQVLYWQTDVCDLAAMQAKLGAARERFGPVQGVIHAAGLEGGSQLSGEDEFASVLAPKVGGTLALEALLSDEPLDFVCYFSSLSAVLGDFGSCDYAVGNRFQTAYAGYRQQLVAQGKAKGQTVAINWPLWKDGGMGQQDEAGVSFYLKSTGQRLLEAREGCELFECLLGEPYTQQLVLAADPARASRLLGLQPTGVPVERKAPVLKHHQPGLAGRTVVYLKKLLSSSLQLPVDRIDPEAALEEYGIDSVLVMQMTGELEKVFGSLSKTLFFEYQTIDTLAGYFLQQHRDRLAELLGETQPAAFEEVPAGELVVTAPAGRLTRRGRRRMAEQSAVVEPKRSSEIAIVGLSGRYPGAASVAEFWQNLKNGKDCITEIPGDRWDYRLYFDAEKGKAGKSYSKWGGFIDGVDRFDSLFFNISPREAQGMDPQERLFLECIWSTLEDGGYTRETAAPDGKVGVFVGVMYEEYQMYGAQAQALGYPYALPGNPATIANRVSYFCNFHGPSMAVDTMCSSSLTAIHLACQSLERGECVSAVAGGVNLSVHPNKYLGLSQGQFVSSKGRCESFGEGGDGYVPGEGVGAVLLKPLWRAEADGDHIYGVIKASALNHGGKTNGYSVPNPQAQAAVIGQALQESHIPARAVTYIEAHGTGTSLGDPIEMAGLGRAFSALTDEKGFCAVGSAKSNIGHCESAAGIAGLTKVLLQMQHGQLAPSLHAEKLNPHIEFAGSPFAVQRELAEWHRPRIGEREYPRIAGLSSFGAGGANAHMVISEYVPVVNREEAWSGPALIVLSARQPEGLRRRVEQLLAALAERREADLGSIAYTLQVGREGMEHRLALSVRTLAELRDRLQRYLAGEAGIEDLYTGEVKRNKETVSVFSADEDLQGAVEAWLAKGKYGKLLAMWVKGLSFDWSRLYAGAKPQRISLPAYPFSGERHWVPKLETSAAKGKGQLHPLLHENTSDLEGVRFRSIFSGEEFFLADHVVQGHRMLPGVAYLEMARAAVEQISGERSGERLYLRSISWERPLVVEGSQAKPVEVELWREDTGEISYQMVDQTGEVYSRGVAGWQASSAAEVLDIGHYRGCLEGVEREAAECYQGWSGAGIEYGPGHRGLESVGVGREAGGQRFALGRLSLPEAVSGSGAEYVLHPSVLDAALQATIGLMEGEGGAASLPFAVERVEIYGASPERGWALVRESAASTEKVRFLDIDVCDEQGELRLRLHRFSARVLEAGGEASGTVYLERVFAEQDVEEGREHEFLDRWLFLVDVERAASIAEQMSAVRCVVLERAADGAAEAFEQRGLSLLEQLSEIARTRRGRRVLVQVAAEGELYAGLSGLLKTAHLEDPNLVCQLILLEAGQDVAARIEENVSSPALVIRYRDGVRQVESYQEIAEPAVKGEIFRKGGVYLITGGAGGLGRLFAAEIAARVVGAKLVLVGRSELTAERQRELEGLSQLGREVEVVYDRADVSSLESMESLRDRVERRWGHVDGVIHAAGQLRDRLLVNKTVSEAAEVLSVKVSGAVHLDAISRGWGLDFFVLFSSGAGAWGNVGQSDYALGNAFLDAYAAYRNGQVASGARAGRTLSINWPLWADGGMGQDQATAERGMPALGTAAGLEAFYRALGTGLSQVAVVYGDRRRIRAMLASQAEQPKPVQSREAPEPGDRGLEERTVEYLRRFMGAALQLSAAQVEPDAPLEQYGIDSVLVMRLTSELEKSFGTLPKTLFFEYQTVAELAGYFARSHAGSLRSLLGLAASGPTRQTAVVRLSESVQQPTHRRQRQRQPATVEKKKLSEIAIVGLSGRFPAAANVEEFWQNLRNGKDCITEIPAERWDYRPYFDAEKGKADKSYSKWGGFLDDVDRFDSLFFNISPREAQGMDPQERLFMETVWTLLETSGHTRESIARKYKSKVGVYVGSMYQQYGSLASRSAIANRVSYYFGLQGPSVALDTMCSSAAVAIHTACNDLLRGDCQMAIAGAVNLSTHPAKYVVLSQLQLIGSHPESRSFGKGDGYLPCEAVGAVLLKPLDRAIEDRDDILAVIKATAVNHSGRSNGYSVPSPMAQADLMTEAISRAHMEPDAISYVEAAAAGSALGDPIEVAALSRIFPSKPDKLVRCAIGSVKSNLGHAEAASGITQLAKVVLQLRHRELAPSIKANPLNPNLNLENTALSLQRERTVWESPGPRRALINSFGAGGTNACLVLEEYVTAAAPPPSSSVQRPEVVPLSARTAEKLTAVVRQLLAHLQTHQEISLADLAYTLQSGREPMRFRLAMVVSSLDELMQAMQVFLSNRERGTRSEAAGPLFTGDQSEHSAIRQLTEGKAGEVMMQMLLAERHLEKLALLWTQGVGIPWASLQQGEDLRIVYLPAYPFERSEFAMPDLMVPSHSSGAEHNGHHPPARIEPAPVAGVVPPRTELERTILSAWEDILGVKGIGVTDSFLDLGGNSIQASHILAAIQKVFSIDIPVDSLLGAQPTVEGLALAIVSELARLQDEEALEEVEP